MPVLAHDIYTNEPNAGPYVIFPTHAHQILSNCIHIIGVSILSYCFACRTETDRLLSWGWWTSLSWARLLIILVFLDSWIFLALSGVLVNGVGLSVSVPVCSLGIFVCILFYAGSKALIYLFLVERVWIVCSAGKSVTRLESRIYKCCAIIVCGYLAVFIVMILGRYASVRDDGVCVIGLKNFATIPLLTYDLFINIFLTSMFIWFIYREQSISERLRSLARRTAFASGIALTTSCVNILMLALLHGKQLGWVCLGSCATDVTVNALVLFWVTAGSGSGSGSGSGREFGPQGAWERKDGMDGLGDLPPLSFPVSFVGDPERGLNASRGRSQSLGRRARLAERNLCEGCSRSVRSGGGRSACGGIEETTLEELEWDLSDPSSSGATRFDDDEKEEEDEGDINMDDQSWRLTLDLGHRPTTLLSEHSQFEPDSPASQCTAGSSGSTGSSARLSDDLMKQQYEEREHRQKQQKQPKQRQRQRRWRSRPRRSRARSNSQPASSSSPSSSPPPHHDDLPFSSPHLSPPVLPTLPPECLFSSSPLPAHAMQTPSSRARGARRFLLRSHSDSLVRISDIAMPRLSQ